MAIELGVMLPTSTPDPNTPILGDIAQAARRAEQLGLGSVWSTDHLVASAPILDSGVVLATAAAATERIGIGYGVLLLALRPAAWAAKQVATLQYVSGNRVLLGVGTGNPAHGDLGWRAAGQPFAGRGRRTDESLRLLPDLITGRPTTLPDGTEITLAPGAPMPPVLIAGNGAKGLARAAEFGNGWLAMGLSPDLVATHHRTLTDLAAEHGRPAPRITVIGPTLPTDANEAAEALAAYEQAGAERLILPPTGADWSSTYDRAAALNEHTA